MRSIKIIGCAGIASVALAFSTNTLTLAETKAVQQGAAMIDAGQSTNVVHRVTHSLALSQRYSDRIPSGNKWGHEQYEGSSAAAWAEIEAEKPIGGNKWGRSNTSEQSGSKWGRSNTAEQSGSKWGRSNTAEQSGSKWGRSNTAEQSGSKWGRS